MILTKMYLSVFYKMLTDAGWCSRIDNMIEMSLKQTIRYLKRGRWLIREVPEAGNKGAFWRMAYFDRDLGMKVCAPIGIHWVIRFYRWAAYELFYEDAGHIPLCISWDKLNEIREEEYQKGFSDCKKGKVK